MKFPIPKAFLVYLVLLAVGCILVSYKTNTVNKNHLDDTVSVSSDIIEDVAEAVDLIEEITESEQTEVNPEEKLTVNSALKLLYGAFLRAAEQSGTDSYITSEEFEAFLFDGMRIDGNAYIRRNEFAVFSVRMTELLKLEGIGSIQTDAHINEVFYIPDVTDDLPYSDYILELYRLGIVSGNDGDGNFAPYELLTRHNASVMADRLIDVDKRVKTSIPGNNRKGSVPVTAILQNPELPSGCEITSLTMVLNYLGFDADKCDLADNYLEKGPVGKTNYRTAFIGNPRDWGPHGCFAPVIVSAAEKYLAEQENTLGVYNTTGLCLDGLFKEIDAGNPVVIWATMWMKESYESVVWQVDGERVPWIANEHCMVLHGYDRERNVVLIADPLAGNVEYDRDLFETRFKELFMQSVIIK